MFFPHEFFYLSHIDVEVKGVMEDTMCTLMGSILVVFVGEISKPSHVSIEPKTLYVVAGSVLDLLPTNQLLQYTINNEDAYF
jgi:hypothetical protein